MREIKFRAWDRTQNKMSYDLTLIFKDSNLVRLDNYAVKARGLRGWGVDTSLMQYTGLKDKNGVEIYEGDIVVIEDTYKDRILDDGSGPIEPCNHLAPVVFQHAEFGVKIKQSADIFYSGFWAFCSIAYETGQEEYEVIGNIWENPELLGVK